MAKVQILRKLYEELEETLMTEEDLRMHAIRYLQFQFSMCQYSLYDPDLVAEEYEQKLRRWESERVQFANEEEIKMRADALIGARARKQKSFD